MRLNLLTACTVAVITFSSSITHATTVSCDSFIADGTTTIAEAVTNHDGCQLGGDSQDSVAQVNSDNMFSLSDWEFIAKDNDLDGTDEGTASALTLTGTTLAGTWAVDSGLFSTYANLMLVFKAGNEHAGITPDVYVGYLIDSKAPFSGDYESMFQKSGAVDISHVTLYGSESSRDDGPTPVPLPAGGLLLLTGLFGLGVAKRRRKHS